MVVGQLHGPGVGMKNGMKQRWLDEPEQGWRELLQDGNGAFRTMRRVFGRIPSDPHCKVCMNPFGGVAGSAFRVIGHGPSRKNPNVCKACFEATPPGGAEVDVGILFADVRGSTGLGERSDPGDYAKLMNRFYKAATAVLVGHDALIDKLIGDEVMALFIPGVAGPNYRRRAVGAGLDLLRAVGYGSADGPWLSLGIGVHAGVAYVGNVGGDDGVVDFTALGDPVNVAARLQSVAAGGELVVSEDLCPQLSELMPDAERRTVELKGHTEAVRVLVHSARPLDTAA